MIALQFNHRLNIVYFVADRYFVTDTSVPGAKYAILDSIFIASLATGQSSRAKVSVNVAARTVG